MPGAHGGQILRSTNGRPESASRPVAARDTRGVKVIAVCVLLAALAVVTAVSAATLSAFVPGQSAPLGIATAAVWVLAGCAFLILLRIRGRAAIVLVVAGSAALGLAALAGPPNLSTDSARYAWDGIVQNEGVSPYAHVPAADALAAYRQDWLFPRPATGSDGLAHCAGTRIQSTTTVPNGDLLCTALNRPQVPTIYPPVAEGFFAAVRSVVPPSAQYWPFQAAGLLVSLATTTLLLAGMRRRGLDARWAALWGWSPFVAAEAVTNSHVDALGALLVVAATFAATPALSLSGRLGRGRAILTGVAIGLAAATKFVPALAAPPIGRRRPFTVTIAAAVTFAVTYLPYLAVTGWAVIGYLPGYLDEEGYDSGSRFALLSMLPGAAATVVALVLILAVLAVAWWRTDPHEPWHAQTVSIGLVLLIARPAYPWYALVLIPFIALSRRWEWLAVPLALSTRALLPEPWQGTALLALAAAATIGATVVRRRRRPAALPSTMPSAVREETP